MKKLMYGDRIWLVGDEAADTLIRFSVLMAQASSADAIHLHVLDPQGNPETTSLVIGPASMITAETTQSDLQEPDNTRAIAYMNTVCSRY